VLHDGENRLEVRTRNRFGVEGPVVAAVVQFKSTATAAPSR
jgi:hypothetical protein